VLGLPPAQQVRPLRNLVDVAAASAHPASRPAVREAIEQLPHGVDEDLKRRGRAL
jgi:hypothetical protein